MDNKRKSFFDGIRKGDNKMITKEVKDVNSLEGEVLGLDESLYHQSSFVSASGLKEILKCPLKYKMKYIDREEEEEKEAFRVGSLIHKAVLEPRELHKRIVREPKIDKRTKAGKEAYKAFMDSLKEDSILLKEKDFELVEGVIDTVLNNYLMRGLLLKAKKEVSLFWEDKELGLNCKCRMDAIIDDCIIELKTTNDASEMGFSKAIANFRYDLSAAWYARGFEQVYGRKPRSFVFICIEKTKPFASAMYFADDTIFEIGEKGNTAQTLKGYREACQILNKCLKSNTWPTYNEAELKPIGMPHWSL